MRGPVRRRIEEVELDPEHPDAVVDWMGRLRSAGDGWINLMPGVPDDVEVEDPTRSVFSALFGTAQLPVTMCTWVPPSTGRRAGRGPTVGIMHPRGRFAVSQLSSMGIGVPPGWQVRQDHARRGIVAHPPAGAPDAQVLDWSLRAGAALAMVPLTGRWKARVFLPR